MAKDAATKLLEAVAQDDELQEKFAGIDDANRFVELAAAEGYDFTPEELKDAVAELQSASVEEEQGELSEKDLAAAVGGARGTGFATSGLKHLANLKFKNLYTR